MTFEVEITIRTRPKVFNTELIETATVSIESAETYNEAKERIFSMLKLYNTFEDFMNKINIVK